MVKTKQATLSLYGFEDENKTYSCAECAYEWNSIFLPRTCPCCGADIPRHRKE